VGELPLPPRRSSEENPAAVDASRVSLKKIVLIAAANEVTPARVANLRYQQLLNL
jgi:hypothetical protein